MTVIDVGAALCNSPESIVDLLSGLVNRSLVSADTALSPPRYRLLESVREFGRVRLRESDEDAQANAAHLHAVQQLCERARREMLTGHMKEVQFLLFFRDPEYCRFPTVADLLR